MKRLTKKQKQIKDLVEPDKRYPLDQGIALVKQCASAKFDESMDIALRLGVDPRKSDQAIRGTVSLPHGTGKTVRVLVFAKGDKVTEAKQAGADHVGETELIDKIMSGWMEFDRVVATPDMMAQVGKVAKILGPRGLMPNPKTGTVTADVGKTVQNIKNGQIEFRVDKAGVLHAPVGKVRFSDAELRENCVALLDAVKKLRPNAFKGTYIQSVALNSTMGPGIALDNAAAV